MEKELFIYRHGETDLNRQGIVQGSGVDAPLNAVGHQQAQAFFRHYQDHDFELLLTSHLQRTHQTAMPFAQAGIPWMKLEEINEINWGIHEGKKSDPGMRKIYKEMLDEWDKGNYEAKLEGGESAAEMAARLQQFIDFVVQRPEQKILVCSHGRAMRCLMCLLNEDHLKEMDQYPHSNTGLYHVLYREGTFSFLSRNDTRHLEGLKTSDHE
jgi:broad specificity phosphatase PhoE